MVDTTPLRPPRDDLDRAVALIRELDALRTEEPEVPSAWDRFTARAADAGLEIVAWAALALVGCVAFAVLALGDGREIDRDFSTGQMIALLAPTPVWLVLVLWNEIAGFGPGHQTLGKRLLGVQVVRAKDGAPAGLKRMLARAGLMLLVATIVAIVWVIAPATTPVEVARLANIGVTAAAGVLLVGRHGRGLHDHLCGTRLVRPR